MEAKSFHCMVRPSYPSAGGVMLLPHLTVGLFGPSHKGEQAPCGGPLAFQLGNEEAKMSSQAVPSG